MRCGVASDNAELVRPRPDRGGDGSVFDGMLDEIPHALLVAKQVKTVNGVKPKTVGVTGTACVVASNDATAP